MKRALFFFVLFSLLIGGSALAQAATEPATSDLQSGWQQLPLPNGICARGTPYSFLFRAANPDKLMVFFEGGGACWNADTCKIGGTFTDSVPAHEASLYQTGIFNFNNPQNPIADYSIVVVSYCTGDLHLGSATHDFTLNGSSFTIHFNGFANTQGVLNWTYANVAHPSQLVITGSSAGAYGAIFYAPYIMSHYPDASATVLGDSGVGVRQGGFEGLSVWNEAANVYPGANYTPEPGQSAAAAYQATPEAGQNDDLYTRASAAFPKAKLAEYTSAYDATQSLFYVLGGGSQGDWNRDMHTILGQLDQLPNFQSYIAPGNTHTILGRPLFYTLKVNNVSFRDWFTDLIGGGTASDVACSNCGTP